jgi:hypothetical protein
VLNYALNNQFEPSKQNQAKILIKQEADYNFTIYSQF